VLDGAEQAIAGAIDHDIDAAESRDSLADRSASFVFVTNIELYRKNQVGMV
jgi:hypothetical protein